MLKATYAIYKKGRLAFTDEQTVPEDGTRIIVIFLEEMGGTDPIKALRGRGKGERLVEKLLKSRREDLEADERSTRNLRS